MRGLYHLSKVIFISNTPDRCGVNQYGKSVYGLLSKSDKLQMCYAPCDTYVDAVQQIYRFSPDVIVYNYHRYTMAWLDKSFVKRFPKMKQIAIEHEVSMPAPKNLTKRIPQATLPRVLYPCVDKYKDKDIPIIGSFGFGGWHKNFHGLVSMVQEQFDEAVIRLHMPPSAYIDPTGEIAKQVSFECISRVEKPGIKLEIDFDFFTLDQLLTWLNQNTLNAFNYVRNKKQIGISSVIDWALSARRPIAISDSFMFSHLADVAPLIRMDMNPLQNIIDRGTRVLEPYYRKWSNEAFIKTWERILLE